MQDGATALIMAARDGHTEVVKLLLDKGAKTETAINVSNDKNYLV